MNTTGFLTIATAIVPDRPAMIFEDRRISYAELEDRVNRLSNSLADLGVGAGDRIAMLQVNCNQYVEAYFAAARLDAVYVPLNFRARADELTHMLNDAAPKVIFAGERYVSLVEECAKSVDSLEHFVALEDTAEGWHGYESLIESGDDYERVPEGDDDDLTMIMFTSGHDELPRKASCLSHDSFSSYILATVTPADPEEETSNILTVPMYHIAGVQSVMSAIFAGRTLLIQRQFEAKQWMEMVEKERANRAMMVPTMLKMLMDHPDFHRHDLSSLEVITYGAAPMPLPVIRQAIREFPRHVLHQRLRPDRNRCHYHDAPAGRPCARRRRGRGRAQAEAPEFHRQASGRRRSEYIQTRTDNLWRRERPAKSPRAARA